MDAVTRYLCSSVYLQDSFRKKVLALFKDKYRIIADPCGLDLMSLYKHALNAENRSRSMDWALFCLSVLGFLCLFFGSKLDIFALYICFFIIYSIAVVLLYRYNRFEQLVILRSNVFKDGGLPDRILHLKSEQLSEIAKKKQQVSRNIVYYSGFYPFVGCGFETGSWSFAIDIDKGKRILDLEQEPQSFHLYEIYDYVSDHLKSLNYHNFSIKEKAFINGKHIRGKSLFLPNILSHPYGEIDENILKSMMDNFDDCRYYLQLEVCDWKGDLMLNIFLRFCKTKKSLFIEANYYVLPPIDDKYKSIDLVSPKYNFKHQVKALIASCFKAPVDCLVSSFSIFNEIMELFQKLIYGETSMEKEHRKKVENSPNYNYGASTSVREMTSSSNYSELFQRLDKEMYIKIVEKKTLGSILNFLDINDIDTSEFKEREHSILNNGVIMSGGKIKAENIAVGSKAKTKQTIH